MRLNHKELIIQVLENLMLPKEITVVHVPGHQKGHRMEAQGNRMVDEDAKKMLYSLKHLSFILPQYSPLLLLFQNSEEKQLSELGSSKPPREDESYPMAGKCSQSPL
jgi:hypothetical protein